MDPQSAPAVLRELPSWLLAQAAAAAARLVGERLGADGAHRWHFTMLAALAEFGPMSQADLGRRVGLDRSDVTAAVTELEAQGVLERGPDPANRRRNLVRITASGQQRLAGLAELVGSAQDELFAALSEAERRSLVRLLTKVLG